MREVPMLEKSTWKSLKNDIKEANLQLFEKIESLSVSDNMPLYLATYEYGDYVKKDGVFYLVDNKGNNISIDNQSMPDDFVADLDYRSTIPMGLVIAKSVELYVEEGGKIIPFGLYQTGDVFGLNAVVYPEKSLDLGSFWQMTAGCRSTFTPYSISNAGALNSLSKKYSLDVAKPAHYYDHWEMFRALSKSCNSKWEAKVIYFPRQWFDPDINTACSEFRLYLYDYVWVKMMYWKNIYLFDMVYSRLLSFCKGFVPNIFIIEVVKHLILMASGALPGFTFASDENAIPMSLLTNIFTDDYKLKDKPIFLTISDINRAPDCNVYYSLAVQTNLMFLFSSHTHSKRIGDLNLILRLIGAMHKVNWQEELKGNLYELFETFFTSQVRAFHYVEQEGGSDVISSDILPTCDTNLAKMLSTNEGTSFSTKKIPFYSGLIQLSKPRK